MVELQNLLKFCNIIIVILFSISCINNYVLLSKNYIPLNFIINTFILFTAFVLLFIRLYPEKINIDLNIDIINFINFILQFICGLFMLGLSNVSIGIGIISIILSLVNLFTFIFIDSVKKPEHEVVNDS